MSTVNYILNINTLKYRDAEFSGDMFPVSLFKIDTTKNHKDIQNSWLCYIHIVFVIS